MTTLSTNELASIIDVRSERSTFAAVQSSDGALATIDLILVLNMAAACSGLLSVVFVGYTIGQLLVFICNAIVVVACMLLKPAFRPKVGGITIEPSLVSSFFLTYCSHNGSSYA